MPQDKPRADRRIPLLAATVPAIAAVVLSLPVIGFAYLFDDYDFLARAQTFRPADLLPDPKVVFYRPVSREIYVGLVNLLSPTDPLLGHIVNAVLLASALFLSTRMMMELAGYREGLVAGLILSGMSQWPVLVAWLSGGQDLLPIVLTVAALLLMWREQVPMSLLAFLGAVLAKESAVAAGPALLYLRWLTVRSRSRILGTTLWMAALVGIWAVVHPGVRLLLQRGSASPEGSYIGLENPNRWGALLEAATTLLNLPMGIPRGLRGEVVIVGVIALTLVVSGLALAFRLRSRAPVPPAHDPGLSPRECQILGLTLALPVLLVTSLLVKNWAGYYACFPAVGFALAIAPRIASRRSIAIAVTVSYLLLGVLARGVQRNPEKLTELSLTPAGMGLKQVEENFKKLEPQLPPGSIVYVTTMATGAKSIYYHMHFFQAPRIWYGEPTLHTLRPELRLASSAREHLFLIEPNLDVSAIDVIASTVRSSGETPDQRRIRSTLRSYALGLANSGSTDRAVEILLRNGTGVDARIAAMLLLSQKRVSEAGDILVRVPDMKLKTAFDAVAVILMVPTRGIEYERAALLAFGLSYESPEVIQNLTGVLFDLGYTDVAGRLAKHLLHLQPENRYASYVLARLAERDSFRERITVPVPRLEFPDLQ